MGLDLGGAFLATQESRFGLALANLRHAVGMDVHLTQSASKTLPGVAYVTTTQQLRTTYTEIRF